MADEKTTETVEQAVAPVAEQPIKKPRKKSAPKNYHYESSIEEIRTLVQARFALLYVITHEEGRIIPTIWDEVAKPMKKELYIWSGYRGLMKYEDSLKQMKATGDLLKTVAPHEALAAIENMNISSGKGAIYLLQDFNQALQGIIPRQLKDIYEKITKERKNIIITAGQLAYGPGLQKSGLEPTLEKLTRVVDFDLLDKPAIKKRINTILEQTIENAKKLGKETKRKLVYSPEEVDTFAATLQGLTYKEIDQALMTSLIHLDQVSIDKLMLEKKQLIKRSEILEFVDQKPSFDQVGGLDEAKRYFQFYSDQFSPEAKEFGVEPLRGVLLLGCPGTGKSLLAKAVAEQWKLPLLRLDVGRVMSGIVGSSENRMRDALAQTNACSPCCLWIDEIEKALSGTKSSNFSDSGTLSRVFGTLLTWMEESAQDVVVLATANDISQIPPELIRRFSEVFFVDLPEPTEREDIFKIHLRKRGRDAKDLKLDMEQLVKTSHHYTGSEIERAVKEGIARSWRDGKRKVKTDDILGALQDTKPISKVMAEKINELREWAHNRARYASSLAAASHRGSKKKLTAAELLSEVVDEAKIVDEAKKDAAGGAIDLPDKDEGDI